MPFLPIVQRELQSRSRRGLTYWSRCLAVAMAVLFCFQFFLSFGFMQEASESSRAVYAALSMMALLLACGGVLLTADSVSAERREGTLGLLFLTNLKGYDVALGKLAANGLDGLYVLAGFAPVMVVPLLAGGITGGEILRMMLTVLNTLWLALALGLWVSARGESQFRTMRGALLRMLGFLALPWLLACFEFHPAGITLGPAMFSPIYPFCFGAADRYENDASAFWSSLVLMQLVSWFLLAAAARALARNWRVTSMYSLEREGRENIIRPLHWAEMAFTARTTLARFGPVCAHAMRLPGQTAAVWTVAVLWLFNGITWAVCKKFWFGEGEAMGYCVGINLICDLACAGLLAWAAGRFIFNARQSGELEMLLCTPAGARDIVAGQWRALRRRLFSPAALMLVASFFLSLLQEVNEMGPFLLTVLYASLGVIDDLFGMMAICWLGMWLGARLRKMTTAVTLTAGLVVGLPWVAISIVYAMVPSELSEFAYPVLFFGLTIGSTVLNYVLYRWAKGRLQEQFRNFSTRSWSEVVKRNSEEAFLTT